MHDAGPQKYVTTIAQSLNKQHTCTLHAFWVQERLKLLDRALVWACKALGGGFQEIGPALSMHNKPQEYLRDM